MTIVERLDLQAAVLAAQDAYRERRAAVPAAREAAESAELAAEEAWCALVDARWNLARAQGVDPVTVAFQEV